MGEFSEPPFSSISAAGTTVSLFFFERPHGEEMQVRVPQSEVKQRKERDHRKTRTLLRVLLRDNDGLHNPVNKAGCFLKLGVALKGGESPL